MQKNALYMTLQKTIMLDNPNTVWAKKSFRDRFTGQIIMRMQSHKSAEVESSVDDLLTLCKLKNTDAACEFP